MSILIKQSLFGPMDIPDIKQWLHDNDIEYEIGHPIVNPETFQPEVAVKIEDEKGRTAFLLRWSQ